VGSSRFVVNLVTLAARLYPVADANLPALQQTFSKTRVSRAAHKDMRGMLCARTDDRTCVSLVLLLFD